MKTPIDDLTAKGTVGRKLEDHINSHTNYYMVASNHLFKCKCLDCTCFLVFTGLLPYYRDEALRDNDMLMFRNAMTKPVGEIDQAIDTLHLLAERYL